MIRRRQEVTEGQRYVKRGLGASVWEVVAVTRDAVGKLHVRLVRVDDPKTMKTLAATVLDDPAQFTPAGRAGAGGSER
ncbi:hypothetical protein [Oleisolibacter albus]|uniref:hypothetical protein n=1 Tax=Oleisolibacter albus TaxID=2171757 RepID=UPI000DF19F39|nr:hypothetical protein [Oleisolibacter albus]